MTARDSAAKHTANGYLQNMPEDLSTLPSDELIRRAKRSRFERALARSGFLASIVLILALWVVALVGTERRSASIAGATLLCLGAYLLIALFVFPLLQRLANVRNRRIVRELIWRHGKASAGAYRRLYFRQPIDDSQILILHCATLPYGSLYDARILLSEEGKFTIDAACVSMDDDDGGWENTRTWSGTFQAPSGNNIISLIEKIDTPAEVKIGEQYTDDGLPARLHILQPNSKRMISIHANLSAFDDDVTPTSVRVQILDLMTKKVISLFDGDAVEEEYISDH